jgi:hypothetical protein
VTATLATPPMPPAPLPPIPRASIDTEDAQVWRCSTIRFDVPAGELKRNDVIVLAGEPADFVRDDDQHDGTPLPVLVNYVTPISFPPFADHAPDLRQGPLYAYLVGVIHFHKDLGMQYYVLWALESGRFARVH